MIYTSSSATFTQRSKRTSQNRWPVSWVNWKNQQANSRGRAFQAEGRATTKALRQGQVCQGPGTEQQEPLWLECREGGMEGKRMQRLPVPDHVSLRGLGKDSGFSSKWVEGYKQECNKFWVRFLKDDSGCSVGADVIFKGPFPAPNFWLFPSF